MFRHCAAGVRPEFLFTRPKPGFSAIAASARHAHHSAVTEQPAKRGTPSWLWPTLILLGVVVALVALGQYAEPPESLREMTRGRGRMLPRVPGPAPDLRGLLYMLGVGSLIWYAIVLAFPLLVLGARKIDVERQGRVRAIAIPALVLIALIAATSVVQYWSLYRDATMRPGLGAYFPQALRVHVLPWIAVAGIAGAIEARRRAVHAALDRERLRAQIAEQRLIALTGQLHPHFLFNTLQGISTLIHRDPDAADEMLAKLSDLLRDLLRHRDHALVPLADELRYARTYLEIARLRFANRLQFEIDVDPSLDRASVPLFILPKTHLWRGTMKQAEDELDPAKFVRIHRSVIVAIDRILTVRTHDSGGHVLELKGGVQLRSSRQYADNVRALLR